MSCPEKNGRPISARKFVEFHGGGRTADQKKRRTPDVGPEAPVKRLTVAGHRPDGLPRSGRRPSSAVAKSRETPVGGRGRATARPPEDRKVPRGAEWRPLPVRRRGR